MPKHLFKMNKEGVREIYIRVIQVMLMVVKVFVSQNESYSGRVSEMNGGMQGSPVPPELSP